MAKDPIVQNELIAAALVSVGVGMGVALVIPNLISTFNNATTAFGRVLAGSLMFAVFWGVGSLMDYQWIDNMGLVDRSLRPLTKRMGLRLLVTFVVAGVFGTIGGSIALLVIEMAPGGMGPILVAIITGVLLVIGFDPEIEGIRG